VKALREAGVAASTALAWGDEMRVGLCGQVRRVWAPRGVKVRQRVQWARVWRYLALTVNGLRGEMSWTWIANMKKESIAGAVREWQKAGVEAVVWDRAGGHQAHLVREVGVRLIAQPAAAPELNPAERVFEELRRAVEGVVYKTIEEKMTAIEGELKKLAADRERVQRLAGWSWIAEVHTRLAENTASS
jgi:DDE superfamily endonuclease